MLYIVRPDRFDPKFQIVSLFLEHNGRILLLLRHPHKSQGNKWGVPAGKVEANESLEQALGREVFEETGFTLDGNLPRFYRSVFVKHPEHSFIYHMYALKLPESIDVKIQPYEHADCRWVTPVEAVGMNLVDDLDACINMYYGIAQ